MKFSLESFGLPDSYFILLSDLIQERTGMNFTNSNRDLLAEKLFPRVVACGFSSFLDYYYLLKYDDNAAGEWTHLMDVITVQETFFWREVDQIKALVNVLVPEHFAQFPNRTLRIWSAACATGEEPISIAMALNETGLLNKVPIKIYASDASASAIAKAKTGLYRERSFRTLPLHLQTKYFFPTQDNKWQIIPEIHDSIEWSIANLVAEDEIKYLASANIIFCRNVFIYFDHKTIRKTVDFFAKYMPKPAYLCVAASESLLRLTNKFELQEINGAFIYVKS
ncbi:protein-glutamate O-methyltransferase CheR [Aerosakkonemataceae cyanobacterium BLCC-F154]|uniref:protein-glutamate O-methyltransferase n=1 Tax=Floridaenema fluviatile BLCC-F154 TaxID=3153640 RepID=A0ABV4YD10_9CYAN